MFAQAHRQKRSFARVANIWNRKIVIHRRRYILGNTLFKNLKIGVSAKKETPTIDNYFALLIGGNSSTRITLSYYLCYG